MRVEAAECEAKILQKISEAPAASAPLRNELTASHVVQACADVFEDAEPGEAWAALVALICEARREEGRELIVWTVISQLLERREADRELRQGMPTPLGDLDETWEACGVRLMIEASPPLADAGSAALGDDDKRDLLASLEEKRRWYNRNRIFSAVAHEVWTRRFNRMTARVGAWLSAELAKARAMFEQALQPEHDNCFEWPAGRISPMARAGYASPRRERCRDTPATEPADSAS